MKIKFSKYQGTGNDFVMLDNINGAYDTISLEQIQFLCDRKVGVGADGLIKLSKIDGFDFEVEYYNADGSQSFCGNGARCSVAFAKKLGLIASEAKFLAIDGEHRAKIDGEIVTIDMLPVEKVDEIEGSFFLDTGSPHYVTIIEDEKLDIVQYGKSIRYSDRYKADGVNVNTLKELSPGHIKVETYERGVEDETLSCGTGVTACALLYKFLNPTITGDISIETKGGKLNVKSSRFNEENGFDNIWLSGPAMKVYNGTIDL